MKSQKGFTLIELLVIIAIIGILSSVVLASLNSARQKGQVAAIKSNLKNMIAQAELTYEATGNYSTTCASLTNMITAISNAGGTAICYSHNISYDVNTRWAVSARLNSDSTKNWSVDGMGVVEWDAADVSLSMLNWDAAYAACANIGGRLPSPDQLRTLYLTYGSTPPGYVNYVYWSSITDPTRNWYAFYENMLNGSINVTPKNGGYSVRCVR
jgi:prepilin-type N-terminal cleavage/methylation domain-containing protein